jgi:hypothetical protein
VRAQLFRTRTTKEGEVLHQHQAELNVGTDGGDNNLFFIWPMTVVHRIDNESPLYNISASDIIDRESRFEIVVILEGNGTPVIHGLKHVSISMTFHISDQIRSDQAVACWLKQR